MADALDGILFRIERALARVWKMQVQTTRRATAVYYRLGRNWSLRLESDQIERLADYLESDAAFKEQADKLLDECMTLVEFRHGA